MQLRKFSLLVLFGLFITQAIVPMDAPTKDDGEFKKLVLNQQSNPSNQKLSSGSKKQKDKGKEKILPGSMGYPPSEIPYEDIDPKLLIQVFNQAPEKLKDAIRASKVKWVDPRYHTKILLLVGAPGVGKTVLAKAIAFELNKPYLYFNTTDFSSSYQHSKIQSLRKKVRPFVDQDINVVLILDEITHLTEFHDKKETRDLDPGAATALWLLIDQIKRKNNVWLIGTTNYLDKVPEQIKQRIGHAGIFEIDSPINKKEIIVYHVQQAFGLDQVPENILRKLDLQLKKKTPREIETFICCLLRRAAINHPEEQTVALSDVNQVIKENSKRWSLIIWDLAKKGKPYYLPAIRETIHIGLQAGSLLHSVLQAREQNRLQKSGLLLQGGSLLASILSSTQSLAMQREGLDSQQDMHSQNLDLQRTGMAEQQRIHEENKELQKRGMVQQREMHNESSALARSNMGWTNWATHNSKKVTRKTFGFIWWTYKQPIDSTKYTLHQGYKGTKWILWQPCRPFAWTYNKAFGDN